MRYRRDSQYYKNKARKRLTQEEWDRIEGNIRCSSPDWDYDNLLLWMGSRFFVKIDGNVR